MKKLILLLVTAIALAVPAQAKSHAHHHKGPHRTEHVHVSPNPGSASIRGSQRHSVAPKPVKHPHTTSKHTHHPRPITLPGRPRLDHPYPTMYVIDQHPVIYTTQPHHYRRHNRWYSGFWFWSQNY